MTFGHGWPTTNRRQIRTLHAQDPIVDLQNGQESSGPTSTAGQYEGAVERPREEAAVQSFARLSPDRRRPFPCRISVGLVG